MRGWLKDLMCKAAHEIGGELRQMGAHGSHELAAALFNGSPFVMYQKGSHDDPSVSQSVPDQAHVEHEREM